MIDDDDGGPLVQRPDDEPETVRKRLAVYREQTVAAGRILREPRPPAPVDATDADATT